ncbi:hypothetical protein M5X11_22400 [Paenibacillus alginolyticus]|uniref:hypothetical protein n=1 Tax=Paenibacillus alginolyticus TaxID=59839 RepID=UPI0003FA1DE0|nr:hypothetical protein [Paenibacillus alginolyticus]MCY9667635.1 hypothetical protein [Paenibacillus alginolyticus]
MNLTQQSIPYEKVEAWLMSYSDWKARLAYAQAELKHIPGLTRALHEWVNHGNGRKQEPLLRMVIHRIEITEHEIPLLLSRIGLIDYAFSALTAEEILFVRLRYLDKLALSVIIDRIALSRRAFFYHRKRILHKVYRKIKDRAVLLELDSFGED